MELGNLFENAALDEFMRFVNLFYAENEEEASEIFFGRGPIAGNLGPTFSTVLDFMTLVGMGKVINKNDTLSFMLGMKDAAEKDNDMSKSEQITKMINIQAHRTLFKTGPNLLKGDSVEQSGAAVLKGVTGIYNKPKEERNERILRMKKSFIDNPDSLEKPLQHIDYNKNVLNSLDYMDKKSSVV
jgi:hypothetical protein